MVFYALLAYSNILYFLRFEWRGHEKVTPVEWSTIENIISNNSTCSNCNGKSYDFLLLFHLVIAWMKKKIESIWWSQIHESIDFSPILGRKNKGAVDFYNIMKRIQIIEGNNIKPL